MRKRLGLRLTAFSLGIALGVFVGIGCVPATASAQAVHVGYESAGFMYWGPHPIPEAWGGGWDATEGSHMHPYAPVEEELFTFTNGHYVFVGDPSYYGYEGDLYWYYGPRPVYTPWGIVISYIDGPHRWWAPPPVSYDGWYYDSGYYYYRGSWPAHYRPHHRVHLRHYYPHRYDHYNRYAPAGAPPHRGRTPAARAQVAPHREQAHSRGGGRQPAARGGDGRQNGQPAARGSAPRYGGQPAARGDEGGRGDRPAARGGEGGRGDRPAARGATTTLPRYGGQPATERRVDGRAARGEVQPATYERRPSTGARPSQSYAPSSGSPSSRPSYAPRSDSSGGGTPAPAGSRPSYAPPSRSSGGPAPAATRPTAARPEVSRPSGRSAPSYTGPSRSPSSFPAQRFSTPQRSNRPASATRPSGGDRGRVTAPSRSVPSRSAPASVRDSRPAPGRRR